jgi:hypothetical protein
MNSLIVKADNLFRYQEANYDYQWWFDPRMEPQKKNDHLKAESR